MIGVILLEDGTGRGGLRLLPFLVVSCEKFLKACPGLVISRLEPPEFAAIIEKSSLEQELKRNCDNLGRGVRCVFGGGVVHRIFDLINEGLKRFIAVVGIPE